MRVAVDARMIRSSGIGRYARELIRRLPSQSGCSRVILLGDRKALTGSLIEELGLSSSEYEIRHFGAPIYTLREQLVGAYAFSRVDADVLFVPHYNVPFAITPPLVVTIHDLAHIRLAQTFGALRSRLARIVMTNAIRRSRAVIAVSATTHRDVEAVFPRWKNKLHCIPNGVSDLFRPASEVEIEMGRANLKLPRRYVLTVANRKPHKNLGVAAAVVIRLRERESNLGWVVVGDRFEPVDAVDRAREQLGDALLELSNLRDHELRLVYAGASAVLLPSRWEGFGLPALEAMACGTPVVVSSIPALEDVVGDAGILCQPDDVEGFVASLQRVLSSAELSQRLAATGIERAREFSWDRAAATLVQVLQEAAECD